jgi:hypothetical protein
MSTSHHHLENELLKNCCGVRTEENAARIRQLCGQSLDWEYLYAGARRHAIWPLLYEQLGKAAGNLVPGDFLRRLKLNYQQNAARNIVLTDELVAIIHSLEDHGIESVPFKGPVLAMLAYGDLARRCFIDLDLIVRRHDVDKARDLLEARGYSNPVEKQVRRLIEPSQHSIPLARDGGRIILELHWRVSANLFAAALDLDELWDRLETVVIRGTPVKSLPIEDYLLALCVHGSRHLWERFSWIVDIAALIREREIDWRRLLARSNSSGCERMLLLGLYLASELGDAALLNEVKERIESHPVVKRLGKAIELQLFSENGTKRFSLRKAFQYQMLLRENWRARVHYLLFALSPSDGDLRMISLPRFLRFLYYAIRPLRLMTQALRA